MVLHRCRMGGPPELETVYFGSATSLCPETTVARCLPAWPGSSGDLCGDADTSIPSTSNPTSPNNGTGNNNAMLRVLSSPLNQSPFTHAAAQCRQSSGATGNWQQQAQQAAQQQQQQGGHEGSHRSGTSCSSLGSSAWLVSLTNDQALLDCETTWVGRDKPEPAVHGGQRKGSGCALSRARSYPASLALAAAAASAPRDGAAPAAPRAPPAHEPSWQVQLRRLHHAASAPEGGASYGLESTWRCRWGRQRGAY